MKTLNDEINEIKAANTSKNSKKAALAKLGITPYEINIILESVECATRGRFTFGVEIECFVNRGAIRTAAEHTGMAYEYEGYNHRDGHDYFKFTTDASVRGMADPIECVSPVLAGVNGKNTLKNAVKTLNTAGANVNQTCGLHVHIGAAKLTDKQYCNVFVNYAYLEAVIDTFMAPRVALTMPDMHKHCKTTSTTLGRLLQSKTCNAPSATAVITKSMPKATAVTRPSSLDSTPVRPTTKKSSTGLASAESSSFGQRKTDWQPRLQASTIYLF